MKHPPFHGIGKGTRHLFFISEHGEFFFIGFNRPAFINHPGGIANDHIPHSFVKKEFCTCCGRRPRAAYNNFMSLKFFPTTFKELISPASMTSAAPCWSSWKTGISSNARSRVSIWKQRGAPISSRFIPPKTGAMFFTILMISSVSLVSRHIGKASTPAKVLKVWLSFHHRQGSQTPQVSQSSTDVPSLITQQNCLWKYICKHHPCLNVSACIPAPHRACRKR